MLAACSSNSNLKSSFNQRKYTKGYFADGIGEKPTVTGIKATKAEDKKALVSVIEKYNTVENIATLTDSVNATQNKLAKASILIYVKQKQKEANKGVSVIEQTKGAPAEPSTSGTNDDAKQRRINGIVLLILAAIVFTLGFLLSSFGGAAIIFIVGAIFLAILGIGKFLTHPPPNADNNKSYDSAIGGSGLLLVLGGLVLGLIAGFFLGGLLVGSYTGPLIVIAFAGLVAALGLLIAGIVVCINALNHNDKYRDCAIAGLVIAGIVIILSISGIVLAFFGL
jgi:hypothetical protein